MPKPKPSKEPEDDEDNDRTQARALVESFRVVIAPGKGGGFVGYTQELPAVVSFGVDRHQCLDAVLREQTVALTVALRHGIDIPGASDRRDVLLNLRVSENRKRSGCVVPPSVLAMLPCQSTYG